MRKIVLNHRFGKFIIFVFLFDFGGFRVRDFNFSGFRINIILVKQISCRRTRAVNQATLLGRKRV
jgi:hypothetical protein